MNFSIECEEETDGRWLAEVPQLPGALCYGQTADEAMATLMETRYAGPQKHARPELLEVQGYLDKLMSVASRDDVLRAYLGSQPDALAQITESHRSQFPELEVLARP